LGQLRLEQPEPERHGKLRCRDLLIHAGEEECPLLLIRDNRGGSQADRDQYD
jgi:hypothetical protein